MMMMMMMSDMERNSAGRLFHVTGPANEKVRSPNLVFRCGMVYWWYLRRNAGLNEHLAISV